MKKTWRIPLTRPMNITMLKERSPSKLSIEKLNAFFIEGVTFDEKGADNKLLEEADTCLNVLEKTVAEELLVVAIESGNAVRENSKGLSKKNPRNQSAGCRNHLWNRNR